MLGLQLKLFNKKLINKLINSKTFLLLLRQSFDMQFLLFYYL
jgi:hypothetical protein